MTASPAPRYRLHETPIGDVLIVTTDEGIVTLHPLRTSLEAQLEHLSRRLGAVPEHDDTDATACAAALQLDEYFDRRRQEFALSLDWRLVRGFTRDALEAVRAIPYGETAGYGEVAITAGSPRASRAVGTACATTPFSIIVPVHRVVRADGSIGEYGGHPEVKRFLLDLEQQAAGE
ncbi:methylated-DNA--[protein]-cysteine S-methyltransferase [Microbacterium pygmaeum]|uniref:methylated-DNA--[protein]-cysteine S-methyltransferase n=1 Tax=Microbacterium pygmaeum TaxID=370764 RepID=A0A1G7YKL9_9MICO|nr:methylated-DNA--[protein]-cysteine S-methyltransferase [Microbacterium pygmaeum]SDG96917.1 methylated-DNA-[protein]-cysteine S-methyltransferase [Microbacterium pygmaeum]